MTLENGVGLAQWGIVVAAAVWLVYETVADTQALRQEGRAREVPAAYTFSAMVLAGIAALVAWAGVDVAAALLGAGMAVVYIREGSSGPAARRSAKTHDCQEYALARDAVMAALQRTQPHEPIRRRIFEAIPPSLLGYVVTREILLGTLVGAPGHTYEDVHRRIALLPDLYGRWPAGLRERMPHVAAERRRLAARAEREEGPS